MISNMCQEMMDNRMQCVNTAWCRVNGTLDLCRLHFSKHLAAISSPKDIPTEVQIYSDLDRADLMGLIKNRQKQLEVSNEPAVTDIK